MGNAQKSESCPNVPRYSELQCLKVPEQYCTSHRDPYGHGLRIFTKQVVHRNDDSEEKMEKEDRESLKKVFHRVREPLQAMGAVVPQGVRRQKEVLGKLYATLHYEPKVRSWAAETRRVDEGEGQSDEDIFGDLQGYNTPPLVKLWYWTLPVLVFLLCFTIQSFLLHIATYEYILYMDTKEHVFKEISKDDRNQTFFKEHAIPASVQAKQPEGKLPDLIAGKLDGKGTDISLLALDLSGIIPVGLFTVTYAIAGFIRPGAVGLWTKTFIIASILALLKGFCDWITIIPDSAGWSKCKERLGEDIDSLRELNFRDHFWPDMRTAIGYEIMGGAADRDRMRYCADMLISGHTYFAVLFSLSAYKMVRYLVVEVGHWFEDDKRRLVFRALQCCRRLIFFLCWVMIAAEIVLVAMAKFHYTVDMVLSVVLVVILWDSVYIETWSRKLTVGYAWRGRPIADHPWFWGLCPCRQHLLEKREKLALLKNGVEHGRDWVDRLKSCLDDHGHGMNAKAERGLVRVVTQSGQDLEFQVASTDVYGPEDFAQNRRSLISIEEQHGWHARSFGDRAFWFINQPEPDDFPLRVYEVTRKLEPSQSNYLVDLEFLRREVLEDPKALSQWPWPAPPTRKLTSVADESLAEGSPGTHNSSLLGQPFDFSQSRQLR